MDIFPNHSIQSFGLCYYQRSFLYIQ